MLLFAFSIFYIVFCNQLLSSDSTIVNLRNPPALSQTNNGADITSKQLAKPSLSSTNSHNLNGRTASKASRRKFKRSYLTNVRSVKPSDGNSSAILAYIKGNSVTSTNNNMPEDVRKKVTYVKTSMTNGMMRLESSLGNLNVPVIAEAPHGQVVEFRDNKLMSRLATQEESQQWKFKKHPFFNNPFFGDFKSFDDWLI